MRYKELWDYIRQPNTKSPDYYTNIELLFECLLWEGK